MLNKFQLNPSVILGALFPITRWSRDYTVSVAVGDLIAGVTIALTLIPQSIAYASLAGLEPQYGLYASFAGGFVYALMGKCPQINIGPTALLSLLTFTYTNGTNPDFVVLLCFVAGIVQLFFGIVQLGFLVEFVSLPVVSGFTSAAAITIASSQIKGLLGLHFSAESFTATWRGVISHIADTRLADTMLSVGCCIVLFGMKAIKDIRIKGAENEKSILKSKFLKKILWVVGVSRNSVVVVLAAVLAFFIHEDTNQPLILTGNITPGLPVPQVPAFTTTVGNITYTTGEMLTHLGSGLLILPLVGIIANVAIAKAFSNGGTLDATQEIVALGVSNAVSAFFRSFPVNGSFTRSAVSDASGVRTPAAGFYTGIIVILTLAVLTPYFYYIPRAALAAVIVCAVLHMVDVAIIKTLWKTNKLDVIPLLGTFIFCLIIGIEMGLLCGVAIDVMLLLYYKSRPALDIQLVNDGILPSYYLVQPSGNLLFPGAERARVKLLSLKNPKSIKMTQEKNNVGTMSYNTDSVSNSTISELRRSQITQDSIVLTLPHIPRILVIRCDTLERIDYTFLQSIRLITQDWSRDGVVIWFGVRETIRQKLTETIKDAVFCDSSDDLRRIMIRNIEEAAHGSIDNEQNRRWLSISKELDERRTMEARGITSDTQL